MGSFLGLNLIPIEVEVEVETMTMMSMMMMVMMEAIMRTKRNFAEDPIIGAEKGN